MKFDIKDVTFVILVRVDSIQRLENVIAVTNSICKYFNTNIVVLEVSCSKNNILNRLLNRNVVYMYIKDDDPILYRTKYYNFLVNNIGSPYIAIWDTDVVIDKDAIFCCVNSLRNHNSDISFPYNGICYNTPDLIRKIFLENKDIRFLYRNISKMNLLYDKYLVGGAVLINRDRYLYVGAENEKHYGWGNEDYDRYFRFVGLGLNVFRSDNCLFHLQHPRMTDSNYKSDFHKRISKNEIYKIKNSSKKELIELIRKDLILTILCYFMCL